MTTYELVAASIALGAIAVPIITWGVLWLIRRDKIFADLPPGEIPVDIEEAPTSYVSRGAHYWGEVEARSTPPSGVSPGLGGVVIHGSARGRDIAAMILDLAHRGWLQLKQASRTGSADGDWAITRVDQPLDATLDLNEVHLITNIAQPGGTAWLSELCSSSDNRLALVQQDLHREVVARGWYSVGPQQTSDIPMAVLGVGGLLGLVIPLIHISAVALGAGAVILACGFLTSLVVRGATPRTALGTAVRIQTLGLRRYLDEAQSYQFSYTGALETFRTYLPWAVVFELEDKWAEVFSSLDVVARTSELRLARDLGWFENIQDHPRALPPTVPVSEETAPRRGAYSEEDVVATVLMTPEEVAADKASVTPEVTVARRSPEVPTDVKARGRAPVPAGPRVAARISAAARRRALADAGTRRQPRMEVDDDTDRIVSLSPVTIEPAPPAESPPTEKPDGPAADNSGGSEQVPSVRQWVPKEAARPDVPHPRATSATAPAAVQTVPSAPVTPVRAPVPTATPVTPPIVHEERSEATKFSDWMSEFDLAMTGDVDDKAFEATDGGTVITGPERFDVLLAAPLWPDASVHASDKTRHVR